MPDITYGSIYVTPGVATMTTTGSQNGPPGGDGWQMVATLPGGQLPQVATRRLCVIVKGRIGNITTTGATPARGMVQVALGTKFGVISQWHLHNLSLAVERNVHTTPLTGQGFMFLMVQQQTPAISDPTFGSSWNTLSGDEFAVWARATWNGDPAAYAVSFEVAELQWLWFDMDGISVGDVTVNDFRPATATVLSGGSTTNYHVGTVNPGTSGDKFLHFHRVLYQPRAAGFLAPWFQFGWSPTVGGFTGFSPQVGTVDSGNPRWGQNRAGGNTSGPQQVTLSHGCFWYGVHPGGVYLPAMRCGDRSTVAGQQTLVAWHTCVSVKLTNLLDVLARTDSKVVNAAVNLLNPSPTYSDVYVPLERPSNGQTVNPVAFVHGIVQGQGLEWFGAAIGTNVNPLFSGINGGVATNSAQQEGVSSMQWNRAPFSPTSPDVQLRAHFIGGISQVNALRDVRDVQMVLVYLIRDPSNLPNTTPTEPNPAYIDWTPEGPGIGNVAPLLVKPDAIIEEGFIQPEAARIDGGTGYSRTWPLFGRPRRTYQLQWTLRGSAIKALTDFLLANNIFSFVPPDADISGNGIVVSQMAPFEVAWTEHKDVAQVIVQVVELVWTFN